MFRCEHGKDLEVERCFKCEDNDRDWYARSLSHLSNEAFHEAMAIYDGRKPVNYK